MLATQALALAHAGRSAQAVRIAERAATLLPIGQDAVSGPFVLSSLARVYLSAGKLDDAVRLLAEPAALPSWISRPALRVDPLWAPLRSHAGFQRLLSPPAD